jgi:hypothetical protein
MYIKIHQQERLSCSRQIPYQPTKQALSRPRNAPPQKHCPVPTLATCWEIILAIFCSLICSAYALHHEDRDPTVKTSDVDVQLPLGNTEHFEWILDPSPVVMLGACILLGCAFSSFAYRRQEQDKYQTSIFILAITSGIAFGAWLGVTTNVIMLGLIPWALCMAMISSIAVHWVVRRCTHRTCNIKIYCYEFEEKKQVVPEC